jgi:hypothetical protein
MDEDIFSLVLLRKFFNVLLRKFFNITEFCQESHINCIKNSSKPYVPSQRHFLNQELF